MFNQQLEEDIVKSIIDYPEIRTEIFTQITDTDFYLSETKSIFTQLKDQWKTTGDIQLHNIKGFSKYISSDWYVSKHFTKQNIKNLRELTKKRSLKNFVVSLDEQIETTDSGELIEKATKALTLIQTTAEPIKSGAEDIVNELKEDWKKTKDFNILGVDTGLDWLNKTTKGYREGHYWIIGGYTNYGKSTFMIYLVDKLLRENTVVFSTEMTRKQIMEKLLRQHYKKSLHQLTDTTEIAKSKVRIIDNANTVEKIRMELLALTLQGFKPRIVFIDFIQNIYGEGSLYERLTTITLNLQTLAKEMSITIIALSQMSNESIRSKSEVMGFKGSGDIASSADLAIQIIRDKQNELDNNLDEAVMRIQIIKNRHGRLAYEDLTLDLKTGLIQETPFY